MKYWSLSWPCCVFSVALGCTSPFVTMLPLLLILRWRRRLLLRLPVNAIPCDPGWRRTLSDPSCVVRSRRTRCSWVCHCHRHRWFCGSRPKCSEIVTRRETDSSVRVLIPRIAKTGPCGLAAALYLIRTTVIVPQRSRVVCVLVFLRALEAFDEPETGHLPTVIISCLISCILEESSLGLHT
jgi:hypothetical protein